MPSDARRRRDTADGRDGLAHPLDGPRPPRRAVRQPRRARPVQLSGGRTEPFRLAARPDRSCRHGSAVERHHRRRGGTDPLDGEAAKAPGWLARGEGAPVGLDGSRARPPRWSGAAPRDTSWTSIKAVRSSSRTSGISRIPPDTWISSASGGGRASRRLGGGRAVTREYASSRVGSSRRPCGDAAHLPPRAMEGSRSGPAPSFLADGGAG